MLLHRVRYIGSNVLVTLLIQFMLKVLPYLVIIVIVIM